MAQLIGIAVKARLTKDDFDRTMALHPTTAEELVTMYKPSYRDRERRKGGVRGAAATDTTAPIPRSSFPFPRATSR